MPQSYPLVIISQHKILPPKISLFHKETLLYPTGCTNWNRLKQFPFIDIFVRWYFVVIINVKLFSGITKIVVVKCLHNWNNFRQSKNRERERERESFRQKSFIIIEFAKSAARKSLAFHLSCRTMVVHSLLWN